MLSDLINLTEMFKEINFEEGEPLKPFEQLMGCLPPASADLVPRPYRSLMCEPTSPIADFYPTDFKVDMNGKRNPWEGVNLLPFIDVKLLKDTIKSNAPDRLLTADERSRNSRGLVLLYTYDPTANETIPSPNKKIGLPDIVDCRSRVTVLEEPETLKVSFKPELVKGTQIPYPGFPSLNVLPIDSTELVFTGLNCFGTASKYPTMVLTLHQMPELPPVVQLAENVLGKSLYINWPMMHEARVVAISDASCEVRLSKKKKMVKKFNEKDSDRWLTESEQMKQQYLTGSGYPGSGGVQIGEVQVRLKLVPLQGMKTNPATGATKKLFGQDEADVPLQVCLWQSPAPDPRFQERGPITLKDRFPPNSNVVLTKGKYRGCKGVVVGVADESKVGVKVSIVQPEPPFGLAIARSVEESYVSSSDAARILKLNPAVFGKITGSLKVDPGRYDLGLNLKYPEGLHVVGYTREREENGTKGKNKEKAKPWEAGDSLMVVGSARLGANTEGGDDREERIQWEYSPKAIKLVSLYKQKFPQLFQSLSQQTREKKHTAIGLFGANGEKMLPKIREWLNGVETAKLPRSPLSTQALPKEAIAAVEKAADARSAILRKGGGPEESLVKIPASALYREGSTGATDVLLASDVNDGDSPELGDRIVNLCANGIPFGARGTVVSIHDAASGCVEVVMDDEFIGGSPLQGTCSNFRGKLCVWAHLLKISPANSKTVVDQVVPKGSGKVAAEKIITSIEKDAKKNAAQNMPPPPPSAWQTTEAAAADPFEDPVAPVQNDETRTPPRSASRNKSKSPARPTSRHGSRGRGKQGTWREARGPDEKGIGFESRKGKSGLTRWKRMMNSSKKASEKSQPVSTKATSAADLKAVLGISNEKQTAKPMQHVSAADNADAAAGLKAMLGVSSSRQPPAPPAPPADFPAPPPPPASAADKILQMMASQTNAPAAPSMVPAPSTGFNFTYVEEGKAGHPQPHQQQAAPLMAMPQYPGMMAAPYPAYGLPAQGMPTQQPMMMKTKSIPTSRPQFRQPVGPSLDEFPALGDKKDAIQKPAEPAKKEKKAPASIVPSVVASRVKK
jgi:5'-3' exoribonuclease 1